MFSSPLTARYSAALAETSGLTLLISTLDAVPWDITLHSWRYGSSSGRRLSKSSLDRLCRRVTSARLMRSTREERLMPWLSIYVCVYSSRSQPRRPFMRRMEGASPSQTTATIDGLTPSSPDMISPDGAAGQRRACGQNIGNAVGLHHLDLYAEDRADVLRGYDVLGRPVGDYVAFMQQEDPVAEPG